MTDDTTQPLPEHSTAQSFVDSCEATIRAQARDIEAATKENSRGRKRYGELCANERTRQMLACGGGIDATPGESE